MTPMTVLVFGLMFAGDWTPLFEPERDRLICVELSLLLEKATTEGAQHFLIHKMDEEGCFDRSDNR